MRKVLIYVLILREINFSFNGTDFLHQSQRKYSSTAREVLLSKKNNKMKRKREVCVEIKWLLQNQRKKSPYIHLLIMLQQSRRLSFVVQVGYRTSIASVATSTLEKLQISSWICFTRLRGIPSLSWEVLFEGTRLCSHMVAF